MNLRDTLTLKPLEKDHYRGRNLLLGVGRIFGGQLVGQALMAAGLSCDNRSAHSLHCYFLHAGDPTLPVDYRVEPLRDGKTLATRQVSAWQNERKIFLLNASFLAADNSPEYQCDMPAVVGPEDLPDLRNSDIPGAERQRATAEMRVEIRPVPLGEPSVMNISREKNWWLQLIDDLPDSPLFRQSALSYMSDFGLLGTAREIHGLGFRTPGLFIASLDHAVWFHRDFALTDWLLHAMECSSTGHSRGFVRGRIFRQSGELIASVAQEGIMRFEE